jgi:type IV fimbrial biogenesis protein FimT
MMKETAMHTSQNRLKSTAMRMANPRGFTLIELMIAIAILAILLGIAVPSFNDAALSSKLGSYANNMVASTNLARSEAIKRNTAITLCVSTDGTNCATTGGWEQGWIVACQTTSPSTVCDGTGPDRIVFYRQQAMQAGLKMTEADATVRALSFASSGVGTTPAIFTICRATPTVGTNQRQVSISATGRASVARTTSTTCS